MRHFVGIMFSPLRKGLWQQTRFGAVRGATAVIAAIIVAITAGCPAARADAPAIERVLVIGDSQAQGLAIGLQWVLRTNRGYRILDRSKISSGLVSDKVFDWPAGAARLAASEHADVAIVMFGANDRPPVWLHGEQDPKLLAAFQVAYGTRVRSILQVMDDAHIPVVWVGDPVVRNDAYSQDMATLNAIFAAEAEKAHATFLPLWDSFRDKDGAFDAFGPGPDGSTTRLRADDGVHFTAAGYEVIAKLLMPLIDAHRPAASPLQVGDQSAHPISPDSDKGQPRTN